MLLFNPALADEWLSANQLRAIYAGASVDFENSDGSTGHFVFEDDGILIEKNQGRDRRTYWWVESPDKICFPTERYESPSGKNCWRHKVNDPRYVRRYRADSGRLYSEGSWRLTKNSNTTAQSVDYLDPVTDEAFDLFFRDNLGIIKGESPEERTIIASLLSFKTLLLAYNELSLKKLVSDNFKQVEEFQGVALTDFNRNQAFDFTKTAVKHRKIDFNLKSITLNEPKGMATAVVVARVRTH